LIGKGINFHYFVGFSNVVEDLLRCDAKESSEEKMFLLEGRWVGLRRMIERIAEELALTSFSAAPLHGYGILDKMAVDLIPRKLPRANRPARFLKNMTFDIARAGQELDNDRRIPAKDIIRH
jgi:hypothetical protein